MLPTLGVTPYGAVQFQDFYTPAYSESDVGGGGFGLSYASTNATDVRAIGARQPPRVPVILDNDCCFFASPDNFVKTWYFCNDHGRLASDCGDRCVAMRAG